MAYLKHKDIISNAATRYALLACNDNIEKRANSKLKVHWCKVINVFI